MDGGYIAAAPLAIDLGACPFLGRAPGLDRSSGGVCTSASKQRCSPLHVLEHLLIGAALHLAFGHEYKVKTGRKPVALSSECFSNPTLDSVAHYSVTDFAGHGNPQPDLLGVSAGSADRKHQKARNVKFVPLILCP